MIVDSHCHAWLDRLAMEHDNLRAALQWFIDNNLAEKAVRLAGVAYPVWLYGGYLAEGQAVLKKVLALPEAEGHSQAWVHLLGSASSLDYFRGDYAAA